MQEHTSATSQPEEGAEKQAKGNAPLTARGEATRRRILDVAEEVFGEIGYYEASVSEITRRAKVAQGTFYIYFPTKRDIFAELVRDLSQQLRGALRQATAGSADRLETERRGFKSFFSFVASHRGLYRIVQEAERVAPEAAQEYYQGISQGYIRGLRSAMSEGTVRDMEPEPLAYALMGIGHFVALRYLIWPADSQEESAQIHDLPPEVFETLMSFIEQGLSQPAHKDTPK
ncbi:TetR/AcrR family transcriptional regulator [Ktedonobacter racemifer]|uniref:Transcriptional regulator, TetR family n=1 Tax=Ktedonobacter racemifer DSM 44963 TaxID=485913 RepID=D6TSR3_KTERA|nr:TetR/AcrR family transcriptional regulator [Ktedonobacter racemifer]EFH83464.1 transcriptional regulator, TetR family [Ktedonobacter racemifer DSM 44963]